MYPLGDSSVTSVSAAEPELRKLMLRGLDGDAAAYGLLLTELNRFLRAYFGRRLSGRGEDLEDLVQETLLIVHEKRHTYRRDLPLTPWVFAIARHKLLNHHRRAARRPTVVLDEAAEVSDPRNPEEGAVRRDLARLLDFLPWRQRRLLHDMKIAGASVAEAARRAGMSNGAAKVSIHRAMKTLSAAARHED